MSLYTAVVSLPDEPLFAIECDAPDTTTAVEQARAKFPACIEVLLLEGDCEVVDEYVWNPDDEVRV